jgi:hypothetical protein
MSRRAQIARSKRNIGRERERKRKRIKEEEREIIHLVLYLLHGHFTFFLPPHFYFPFLFCGSTHNNGGERNGRKLLLSLLTTLIPPSSFFSL